MTIEAPRVDRIRHELKRRHVVVQPVERAAARMVRVVLTGSDLSGFTSLSFDDHIKVFFPGNGSSDPAMRDFTPCRFDALAGELCVDFFLHSEGPAAQWAARASPGQTLEIAGPRGSTVIGLEGIDTHVLIGDETALPAISRRLDELPPEARALVVVEIEAGATWPPLHSGAAPDVLWVPRDGRIEPPAHEVIDALRRVEFPRSNAFVWVALESRSARAVRRYLREERGLDKRWIKATGYWQRGTVGSHDTLAEGD